MQNNFHLLHQIKQFDIIAFRSNIVISKSIIGSLFHKKINNHLSNSLGSLSFNINHYTRSSLNKRLIDFITVLALFILLHHCLLY